MPFSVEQFFEVFERYHGALWPAPLALNALALAIVALLWLRAGTASRWISAGLAFLWAWMGFAYHFAFFAAINPAAWLFGAMSVAGAVWLVWLGVVHDRLRFARRSGPQGWTGGALIAFALLGYPALASLFGHRYPAIPSFGLPCPTTIFAIGVLLFAMPPVPRSAFVVPLLWSAVGSVAAFRLGVPQDYGLLAAGVVGLTAVVRSYSGFDR